MSHAKDAPKRKRLRKAVPTVGIAGMSLAMAGGASAATAPPTANLPSQYIPLSHEITLGEEEISDVSLGTFYVFDKEDIASELGQNVQLAYRGGCGGRGCGGARGCGGRAAAHAAAPEAAAAEAAAGEAAAWAAAAAGAAAAAAVAAWRGLCPAFRLLRLPITLTGTDSQGRVELVNQANCVLFGKAG